MDNIAWFWETNILIARIENFELFDNTMNPNSGAKFSYRELSGVPIPHANWFQ